MNIEKPDLKLFDKNYVSGKNQILFHSFSADIHTPVSIFNYKKKKIFFCLSLLKKEVKKGRYSVIGIRPDLIWSVKIISVLLLI